MASGTRDDGAVVHDWNALRRTTMTAGAGVQPSSLAYGLLVALVADCLVSGVGLTLRMRALAPE